MEKVNQATQGGVFALGDYANSAIRQISHPPHDIQSLSFPKRELTKKDALHQAVNRGFYTRQHAGQRHEQIIP